jgi:hypothetical protein
MKSGDSAQVRPETSDLAYTIVTLHEEAFGRSTPAPTRKLNICSPGSMVAAVDIAVF